MTKQTQTRVLELPRLREDQWLIAKHPAKIKVVSMGRRWGKTVMSGAIALSAAARGNRVAWISPTYKQSRPLWRWAKKAAADVGDISQEERTITFGDGLLGMYSADNADTIRGEAFHLVIVDEASRVEEGIWTDIIQATLADFNGDAILISTPNKRNWFWREYQRGIQRDEGYAAFNAPSSDNPNPNIKAAAKMAKTRVPDRVYRQEWLAEFVDDMGVTFNRDWFNNTRFDANDPAISRTCIARYHSWDTALSERDESAYSSLVVAELMPDYRLFIREVYRDHLTFPELLNAIKRKAERDAVDGKLRAVLIEDKASGTSALQTMYAADNWLTQYLKGFLPRESKEQRAEQASVWCANGSVWLPQPSENVNWLLAFEDELLSFPGSQFKDQVDSFSQLLIYTENLLSEGYRARQGAA